MSLQCQHLSVTDSFAWCVHESWIRYSVTRKWEVRTWNDVIVTVMHKMLLIIFLQQHISNCFIAYIMIMCMWMNIFFSKKPRRAPWICHKFKKKKKSIVHKQRGLIRAGGSNFSKASKHCSLDHLLMIFVPRHFGERFLKRYDPRRHFFLEIFYAFYQSESCDWIARVFLLGSTSPFLSRSFSLSLSY